MIAITFALPAESASFLKLLRNKNSFRDRGNFIIYGELENCEVAVVHSGVGRKACEPKIQNFLCTEKLSCLISSGFAGAVCDDLNVGDLFLAENFSDAQLFSATRQILKKRPLHFGKLYTSTSVVVSNTERNEVARTNGADAVDMETEVIAHACAEHGIPMLALRGISDTPRDGFPAPPNVLFEVGRQRTNPLRFGAYLMMRPSAIVRLFRFVRRIRCVSQTLAEALADVARELPT